MIFGSTELDLDFCTFNPHKQFLDLGPWLYVNIVILGQCKKIGHVKLE